MNRFPLLLLALTLLCAPPMARGQTVLLGKTPYDSVYPSFYNQQNNASNTFKGLNLYGGTGVNVWTSAMITNVLTAKTMGGTWYVTNNFVLKRTNTVNTVDELFNFKNSLGPGGSQIGYDEASASANDSNTVARLGVKQELKWKLLNNPTFLTNGSPQSGILLAKGNDPVAVVTPRSGTNRFYIRVDLGSATPTNWLEFKEGVLAAAQ